VIACPVAKSNFLPDLSPSRVLSDLFGDMRLGAPFREGFSVDRPKASTAGKQRFWITAINTYPNALYHDLILAN
jgi:hypothetical protein